MSKPKMILVSVNLVNAVKALRQSKQWSVLPAHMREQIEQGLAGNGHTVRN